MYASYITVGPAGREAPGVTQVSVLMPPGTYKVTLKVGSSEQTRDLVVRKDPNTGGTEGDIAEQTRIANAIREDLNRGAAAVHRVEGVRVQLAALRPTVTDAEVLRAITELEAKLVETEMELVDLRQTGQGQDGVRWEAKLLAKISYLAGGLTSNDFKPTDQQIEVQAELNARLRTQLTAIESLLGGDLNALNAMLRQKGIPNIGGAPTVVP